MNSPLILCINDLPELLKLRQATLESYGCSVKTALTCNAALKLLEESPFDAVVLDYKLEGIDAEAMAVKIKQQCPNVPIILLSAFHEMPENILWLVDEYVMVSDLPEGLVRTAHHLLSSKQARRVGSAA